MKNRPAYADAIIREITPSGMTHTQLIDSRYRWVTGVSDTVIRYRLDTLVKLGILYKERINERNVVYKVSPEESSNG